MSFSDWLVKLKIIEKPEEPEELGEVDSSAYAPAELEEEPEEEVAVPEPIPPPALSLKASPKAEPSPKRPASPPTKVISDGPRAEGAHFGVAAPHAVTLPPPPPPLAETVAPKSSPPPGLIDTVDFAALYRHNGVPEMPYTAEQALKVIEALPGDWPLEMRRQAANGMLAAFNANSPDAVVEDARRKIEVLDASVAKVSDEVKDFIAQANSVIEALSRQILEQRRAKESAERHQQELMQKCAAEAERLREVTRFFSPEARARTSGR